jgi:hypothetical protein
MVFISHLTCDRLEISLGALEYWLEQTIHSIKDLLYRRCFALAGFSDQGVDHGACLGPFSAHILLGQSGPQQCG